MYLIDENQKIPDSSGAGTGGSGSNSSSTVTLSGQNNITETQIPTSTQKSDNPATFLMYNRINNIIGGNSTNSSGNKTPSPTIASESGGSNHDMEEDHQNENKVMRNKRPEDKNSSIWYEYGCV